MSQKLPPLEIPAKLKSKAVSCYLTEDNVDFIKAEAERLSVSVNDFMNALINQYRKLK